MSTREYQHIRITQMPTDAHRKTPWFTVASISDGSRLGCISFFPRWRKFIFEPFAETVYEEVCLRDISGFIEGQTKLWRESKAVSA